MKNYSTNITDNQWQFIKKSLQIDSRKQKFGNNTVNKTAIQIISVSFLIFSLYPSTFCVVFRLKF